MHFSLSLSLALTPNYRCSVLSWPRQGFLQMWLMGSFQTSPPSTASTISSCCQSYRYELLKNGEISFILSCHTCRKTDFILSFSLITYERTVQRNSTSNLCLHFMDSIKQNTRTQAKWNINPIYDHLHIPKWLIVVVHFVCEKRMHLGWTVPSKCCLVLVITCYTINKLEVNVLAVFDRNDQRICMCIPKYLYKAFM